MEILGQETTQAEQDRLRAEALESLAVAAALADMNRSAKVRTGGRLGLEAAFATGEEM